MYYYNIECTIDCSSGNVHAQILKIMIFKRLSEKMCIENFGNSMYCRVNIEQNYYFNNTIKIYKKKIFKKILVYF